MRKLYMFNMVSLDGFFEGPDHDITWHNVDMEFNEYAIAQLKLTDLLLFGRLTYELMASYWPTEAALKDDPVVADLMNSIPKIVFSRTLKTAEWTNTKLINENLLKEVLKLKNEYGKEIAIFGSADLADTFIHHGLIDEFRIIVNPVVLGAGTPLFKNSRINLKLLKTEVFKSGNVLLYYVPI
jgi:dihydrofolate reductase